MNMSLCVSLRRRFSHLVFLVVFSQEGVGDTPDSYAYDGNRVRKWNVTTTNYGKVNNDTEIKSKMEACKDEVGLCHFISFVIGRC